MKSILIFITVIAAMLTSQEAPRLKGNYKLVYDDRYQLQTSQISFNDSTFTKKMPDGLTSKGKVTYAKYKVTLKMKNNDDPIEFNTEDLAKDTLKFSTKSKVDLSRTVNRGKMIRIK